MNLIQALLTLLLSADEPAKKLVALLNLYNDDPDAKGKVGRFILSGRHWEVDRFIFDLLPKKLRFFKIYSSFESGIIDLSGLVLIFGGKSLLTDVWVCPDNFSEENIMGRLTAISGRHADQQFQIKPRFIQVRGKAKAKETVYNNGEGLIFGWEEADFAAGKWIFYIQQDFVQDKYHKDFELALALLDQEWESIEAEEY